MEANCFIFSLNWNFTRFSIVCGHQFGQNDRWERLHFWNVYKNYMQMVYYTTFSDIQQFSEQCVVSQFLSLHDFMEYVSDMCRLNTPTTNRNINNFWREILSIQQFSEPSALLSIFQSLWFHVGDLCRLKTLTTNRNINYSWRDIFRYSAIFWAICRCVNFSVFRISWSFRAISSCSFLNTFETALIIMIIEF